MTDEISKEVFLELLKRKLIFRPNGATWCWKKQIPIPTKELEKHKCWECEQAIFNKGNCDPL